MSRLRAEEGFSLVELLVAMMIMLVVFSAVLGALEAFGRQSSTANRRGENQNAARHALDRVTEGVRGAMGSGTTAQVDRALSNDLVFRVVDPASPPVSAGANTAHLMFRRYCVDAAAQVLYEQTLHWSTAAAPALPSTSCPGTGFDSADQVATGVTTAGGAIFSYSPSASSVSRVAIDLSIDMDAGGQPGPTRLQSGVTLRNVSSPPTPVLTCQAVGGGQVLCDSIGTADPDGAALTYAWSYASGSSCTGLNALPSTQPQINQAGLAAGAYCFQLTVSAPSGMSGTATQTVTAR